MTVEMIEPRYLPIIAYADGWSESTAGELTGAPVIAGEKTPEQLDAMKGSLKGAIVLTAPMFDNFVRKDRPNPSDANYQANSAAYATSVGRPNQPRAQGETPAQRIARIYREAGAGVLIKPTIGEHGTVFVTGRDGGPGAVPSVSIASEQYNMLLRYAQRGIPVKLRVTVQAKFYDADNGNAYNVVAELPGTDPVLKDEVVMIGGHLDSWHTGVGATDNADGATTMMEAMRILKAAGAQPKRTIRVALWGRGRAGAPRIGRVGAAASRRRRQQGGTRQVRRLLQQRQRLRSDLRFLSGEQPGERAVLRSVAGAAEGGRHPSQHDGRGRFDRSPQLHRRGRARLQPDSAIRELRHPHAPLEHGHDRAARREGDTPGGDGDGVGGASGRQRRAAGAATASEVETSGDQFIEQAPGPRGSPHIPHGLGAGPSNRAVDAWPALTAKTDICLSSSVPAQLGHDGV
ncbi:MAG: M28 family peptidase [Vicinamibacterales bacterium]